MLLINGIYIKFKFEKFHFTTHTHAIESYRKELTENTQEISILIKSCFSNNIHSKYMYVHSKIYNSMKLQFK